MLRTGDYFTPIWNGHQFFDKPPLFYWAMALSMKVFGINEWSVRAVSAAAGVGTVFVVYLFSERLFGNRRISIISCIVLASTTAFLYRSRTGNMDTFLSFWLTLGVYALYTKRRLLLVIAILAAFLTKWFIAFVFPILFVLWTRGAKKTIGIAFVFSIAWIAGYAIVFGQPFLYGFIGNQIGKVAPTSSIIGGLSLDYLSYLKSGLKVWFLLFIPAFYYAWIKRKKHEAFPIVFYIFLYIVGLSFSFNKSDWFLLPLYPLIAIVVGYAVGRLGRVGILVALCIALFQLVYYKNLYSTPDVARDEARVATVVKERTEPGDVLYVTNYLLPSIAFYSERQTFAVYGNRRDQNSPWILPEDDWQNIKAQPRLFVVTNYGELEALQKNLAPNDVEILFASGDKILVAKH